METNLTVQNNVQKAVRISLSQENKEGKVNASFIFSANGEDLNNFIEITAQKIVKIMQLQHRIKENGGANNAFGLTKSGRFELNITVASNENDVKLLNNFVFSLKQLGEQNPEAVLIDMVEGYKLLTE